MSKGVISSYSEVKSITKPSYKKKLRDTSLDFLSIWNKATGSYSYLRTPRVQFFLIHHVFRDEENQLRKLLERLADTHYFITYTEAVNRILTATIDKPYVVFCSDDGFKNNLRGAQILSEFGARCCFFINPATIENSNRDFLDRFCKERLDFPPVEFLDWHEVSEIQKLGHEIGSHSFNHIRISQKSRDEVIDDLLSSLKVLNQNCGTVRHFAYPYGRFYDFSKEAREIVFDLGFRSCASSERGCHVNHFEPLDNRQLCLRRDHIILDWDINHIMYFATKSARNANCESNLFDFDLMNNK